MELNKGSFQVKYNTTQVKTTKYTASTKRKVLIPSASLIDPLRLLSPVVIAHKIFLQKKWQEKCQCDEILPAHLQQERDKLF